MSKKEEALRRSVLSRESQAPARHRVMPLLAMASVFAGTALSGRPVHVDLNAERGRFSSGDVHPDKCSCKQCSDWRRAERYR